MKSCRLLPLQNPRKILTITKPNQPKKPYQSQTESKPNPRPKSKIKSKPQNQPRPQKKNQNSKIKNRNQPTHVRNVVAKKPFPGLRTLYTSERESSSLLQQCSAAPAWAPSRHSVFRGSLLTSHLPGQMERVKKNKETKKKERRRKDKMALIAFNQGCDSATATDISSIGFSAQTMYPLVGSANPTRVWVDPCLLNHLLNDNCEWIL